MSRSARVVLLSAVALLLAGIVAAVAAAGAGQQAIGPPATGAILDRSDTPATPPPTAAPAAPGFPALTPGDHVRAVRTPNGMLLPAVGAKDGRWQVMTPCAAVAEVPGTPVRGAHVVLDPGHGGGEPGAVGPSGRKESDLNLDVAVRVRDLLRAEGATVVLTRNRDVRMTLATRAAIAQALDPTAFVSIHHNAAPVGTASTPGSEAYHQLDAPGSKRLAGLLWEELQAHLSPFGTEWAVGDQPGARARRSLDTGDDYYGILRNAGEVTTVLSEAAFLSNPAEDALLGTAAFRDAEARAIADAVLRYVRTEDPGSGFVPTKEVATPAGSGGGTRGCVDPPLV